MSATRMLRNALVRCGSDGVSSVTSGLSSVGPPPTLVQEMIQDEALDRCRKLWLSHGCTSVSGSWWFTARTVEGRSNAPPPWPGPRDRVSGAVHRETLAHEHFRPVTDAADRSRFEARVGGEY